MNEEKRHERKETENNLYRTFTPMNNTDTLKKDESLIDKANKIITQVDHTEDDIKHLHQIKWKMSKLYHETKKIAWQMESDFQAMRTSTYAKAMKAGKTDSQSKEAGRTKAEWEYWTYRLFANFAQWMNAQMKAIEQFCIDYYTRKKATEQASMHLQDNDAWLPW